MWKSIAHEIWRLTLRRENYDVTSEIKAKVKTFFDRYLRPPTRLPAVGLAGEVQHHSPDRLT